MVFNNKKKGYYMNHLNVLLAGAALAAALAVSGTAFAIDNTCRIGNFVCNTDADCVSLGLGNWCVHLGAEGSACGTSNDNGVVMNYPQNPYCQHHCYYSNPCPYPGVVKQGLATETMTVGEPQTDCTQNPVTQAPAPFMHGNGSLHTFPDGTTGPQKCWNALH
jgi:hypothetical protein